VDTGWGYGLPYPEFSTFLRAQPALECGIRLLPVRYHSGAIGASFGQRPYSRLAGFKARTLGPRNGYGKPYPYAGRRTAAGGKIL
jgi:hypothetical protein